MKKAIKAICKIFASGKGFSLVELIVAMAVLAIVLSMAAPSLYSNATSESRNRTMRHNRERIVGNLDMYYTKEFDATDTGVSKSSATYSIHFPGGDEVDIEGTEIKDNSAGYDLSIFVADEP